MEIVDFSNSMAQTDHGLSADGSGKIVDFDLVVDKTFFGGLDNFLYEYDAKSGTTEPPLLVDAEKINNTI